jgi:hypothetical protein
MSKLIASLLRLLGYRKCPDCARWRRGVSRRRQSTRYVDDELNYIVCCPACFDDVEEYWDDMWSDYYQGCM